MRISSTQKLVTTKIEDSEGNIITIKKCSEPSPKLLELYQALKYKPRPFSRKKFVVPKSEYIKPKIEVFKYFTG